MGPGFADEGLGSEEPGGAEAVVRDRGAPVLELLGELVYDVEEVLVRVLRDADGEEGGVCAGEEAGVTDEGQEPV